VLNLDWKVIRTSATAGLLIVFPATILSAWLVDDSNSGGWAFVFFAITMLGFAIAGFGAGRLRTDTPMIHGLAAAWATWAVIQAFGVIRRLATGDEISWLALPMTALIASAVGVAGAVFADWSRRNIGNQAL
jgi:hypothetical protein